MSGFTDLINVVGKVAPLLASVLPIPGAGIIGQVVAAAFGGSIDQPTELAEMIEKDPNAAVKLAEIQSNMRVQLEQIAATNLQNTLLAEQERLKAANAAIESDRLDRDSARKLVLVSMMPSVISIVILVGFFTFLLIVLFLPIANQDSNMLFLLLGTISSGFTAVISFWIGSSAGSKLKDEALSQSSLLATSTSIGDLTKTKLTSAEVLAKAAEEAAKIAENTKATKENTEALKGKK